MRTQRANGIRFTKPPGHVSYGKRGWSGGEGEGCRLNGFLGLSLNDRTDLFFDVLVILLDKTVSV